MCFFLRKIFHDISAQILLQVQSSRYPGSNSVSPSTNVNPGGEIDGRSVKIVTPSVAASLELEQ